MASIDSIVQNQILEITGFSQGILPFRYLGIPVAAKRLKCVDYSLLVDTIDARIKNWPRNSLSYAGKVELIRSVLQGLECFWLSILPLPSTVINNIHSLCRKFVWPTKKPPIAWDSMCKPVEDGGMGLKNLKAWNKAFLTKTLWKIHVKKDTLWIRWVNHVYASYGSVWNWDWKKEASSLIKQILSIRDEMINSFGSKDLTVSTLEAWFGGNGSMSRAYDFFVHKVGRWPWKPILSLAFLVPKQRFLLWLFAHGKLLTRDRLIFITDKTCVLCQASEESATHLFFQCQVSKRIWDGIRDWLGMKKLMGSAPSVLKAFRQNYRGSSTLSKMRKMALAATVYHVWTLRNRIMFEDEKQNIEDIIKKIKIQIFRCIPSAIDIFLLVCFVILCFSFILDIFSVLV